MWRVAMVSARIGLEGSRGGGQGLSWLLAAIAFRLTTTTQLTTTMAVPTGDFVRTPKSAESGQEYRPLAQEEHEALLPQSSTYPKDEDPESIHNSFNHIPPFYAHPRSRLHVTVSFLVGVVACLIVQYLVCAVRNSAPIPTHVHTDASEHAGSTEVHQFPPSKPTNAFPSFFPSDVGHAGPTPTGAEPALVATAPAYPLHTGAPNLLAPTFSSKHNSSGKESPAFDLFKHWGNLSPWFSVERGNFGLDSTPEAPDTCQVTALHLLHRHGARYPTSYGMILILIEMRAHGDCFKRHMAVRLISRHGCMMLHLVGLHQVFWIL